VNLNRPVAPEPYPLLPAVPSFALTSDDIADGVPLDPRHSADADNLSPHLAWSGFPAATRSFVVSCFDPDAPTPAGFWHWTALDLPVSATSLPRGAGRPWNPGDASDPGLPAPAFQVANDDGTFGYYGAAPPQGDRPHRYVFAVHALDVPTLALTRATGATPVAFNALFHTLARATLAPTYQR
jgi:Raf kinase inhibitor-like YbhB/YbcL family protein